MSRPDRGTLTGAVTTALIGSVAALGLIGGVRAEPAVPDPAQAFWGTATHALSVPTVPDPGDPWASPDDPIPPGAYTWYAAGEWVGSVTIETVYMKGWV